MDVTARDLLDLLARSSTSTLRLLEAYHTAEPENVALWAARPELYQAFTEALIREGHPAQALDLARERQELLEKRRREGHDIGPPDCRLSYSLALAAARGGNTSYAERLLAPLLKRAIGPDDQFPPDMDTPLRVDIISLQGRIFKDRARRDPSMAAASAQWYLRAAHATGAGKLADGGTFPLINAATMSWLAGQRDAARTIAAEVVERIEPLLPAAIAAGNLWVPATMAEACVLLGRHHDATHWYLSAVELAGRQHRHGDVASIKANLLRLAAAGATETPAWIEQHIGGVVVFSGHMVDSPARTSSGRIRFPNTPALVTAVKAEIRARLDHLKTAVGFCSLACGSDILFAEAVLEREAELHVVLPFSIEDFLRTSVDFGSHHPSMQAWRKRFDDILQKLPRDHLHFATTEPHLSADELYGFANRFQQGLGVLRARQRVVNPTALVVFDRSAFPDGPGGTHDFVQPWQAAGFSNDVIDLQAIRERCPDLTAPPAENTENSPPAELQRPVKAMLFADVAGFSRIPESRLPRFLAEYMACLRAVFSTPTGRNSVCANTWGDGLHVVFDTVADAAEFALTLLEHASAGNVDWSGPGLGPDTPLRIALHVGPVFEMLDVLRQSQTYFGQHINRAARIEPVTVRGCVYASEQFAAVLTMEAAERFVCEFVGVQTLPKNYDRCPVYHVTRL